MRAVSTTRIIEHREIERTLMQGAARVCSNPFGIVCKGLWPTKTAETISAITGESVRAIAYELSGDREPSPHSILAINEAMLAPWRKRRE